MTVEQENTGTTPKVGSSQLSKEDFEKLVNALRKKDYDGVALDLQLGEVDRATRETSAYVKDEREPKNQEIGTHERPKIREKKN